MDNKYELKKIDIKNQTCYYFDDTRRVSDIDFRDNLLDEKSYKKTENILSYDISCKIFMSSITLRIRFHKIDGFIKIYDGIRYLVLLGNSIGSYFFLIHWERSS